MYTNHDTVGRDILPILSSSGVSLLKFHPNFTVLSTFLILIIEVPSDLWRLILVETGRTRRSGSFPQFGGEKKKRNKLFHHLKTALLHPTHAFFSLIHFRFSSCLMHSAGSEILCINTASNSFTVVKLSIIWWDIWWSFSSCTTYTPSSL